MRLGIDIGGTTISIGTVADMAIREVSTAASFSKGASLDETAEYLYRLIKERINHSVESIGIGVPSIVDTVKGIVYNAANIPSWTEFHIKEYLEEQFDVPVSVDNDANCYALGAYRMLGGGDGDVFTGITLGTGVGIGIISGGKLFRGANTGAGELGWIPCKGKSLEYWCSKQVFEDSGLDPKVLYEKAKAGDVGAKTFFREFGSNMATLLMLTLSAYDPSTVVFGGGIANCSELFGPVMMERVGSQFPFPGSLDRLRIEYFPNHDAAILGAALL